MKNNFINLAHPKPGAVLLMLILNSKTVFSSEELSKFCKVTCENECIVVFGKRDLNPRNDTSELKDVWKARGKRYTSQTLIIKQNTHNTKDVLEEIINQNPQIENLKLINALIDVNELSPKIFKNLKRLTLKNTTTASIRSEVFRHLPKLQELQIKKHNRIKWVERNFLKNLTLDYLQIHGIRLDQEETGVFFRNLTGGWEIPSIRKIDWSHNNFGHFSKDLLAGFVNLHVLILTDSRIFNFDMDAFTNLNIDIAYLNKNQLQKVSKKTFGPLLETASFVSLEENNFTCDCEMEWLQGFAKKHKNFSEYFRSVACSRPEGANMLEVDMCPRTNLEKTEPLPSSAYCPSKENVTLIRDYNSWSNTTNSSEIHNDTFKKFAITKDEPELIEIILSDVTDLENVFIWYGSFADTSPQFSCLKILQPRFTINVTADTNYLLCLVTAAKFFRINISDCLPFKTKPLYENQIWLSKKSIPSVIVCVFLLFLFALVMGASILYLSVRKNPTLIRGSKRIIEVKRHDKAQILIMPRDYDGSVQNDNVSLTLMGPHRPLEPSRSSLSCDTISTVSYVSVTQPTQLEILTYRLNRLRELFHQNNSLPSHVPSLPMQITPPTNHRLPPDVDLLFEYEWYTITTTTMTQLKKYQSESLDNTNPEVCQLLQDEPDVRLTPFQS